MDGNRRDTYQDTLSFPTQQRKSFDLQVKKNVFNLVNVMSQRPGEASAAVPHPVTCLSGGQTETTEASRGCQAQTHLSLDSNRVFKSDGCKGRG